MDRPGPAWLSPRARSPETPSLLWLLWEPGSSRPKTESHVCLAARRAVSAKQRSLEVHPLLPQNLPRPRGLGSAARVGGTITSRAAACEQRSKSPSKTQPSPRCFRAINKWKYRFPFPSAANGQEAFLGEHAGEGVLGAKSVFALLLGPRARMAQRWRPMFGPNSDKGVPSPGPGPPPALCKRDAGAAPSHRCWKTAWQPRRRQAAPLPLAGPTRAFSAACAVCALPSEPPAGPSFQNTRPSHGLRTHWLPLGAQSTC